MLDTGRDNPEDTTTVTLSVKLTTKLDHFVVVNVELKGHIVSESV